MFKPGDHVLVLGIEVFVIDVYQPGIFQVRTMEGQDFLISTHVMKKVEED